MNSMPGLVLGTEGPVSRSSFTLTAFEHFRERQVTRLTSSRAPDGGERGAPELMRTVFKTRGGFAT